MNTFSANDRLSPATMAASVGLGALLVAPVNLRADEPGIEVFRAMTNAAIAGTVRGDQVARGTLGLLLDLPTPSNAAVLDTLERSNAIAELNRAQRLGSRMEREAIDALLQRIAGLQGAASRSAAVAVQPDGGDVPIDFANQSTRWLIVDADGPRELFVESSGCTPNVSAFAASVRLPAAQVPGLGRYSSDLASMPLTGAVALRVERGDCERKQVRLALTLEPIREAIARPLGDASAVADDSRPPLPVNRVVVVPLGQSRTEELALMTEAGFVYEVFAAPLTAGVDPAVARVHPVDPAAAADIDDDSGWGVGARLEEFVGTGREERLVLLRATDVQGDVAVLVRARRAIAARLDVDSEVEIADGFSTWLRIELRAGRWDLRLKGATESLDAAMLVHDAGTGALIEANDDESDEILSPRVHLILDKPTVVLIRLISVDGAGSARLAIRPDGNSSLEVAPRTKQRASELST